MATGTGLRGLPMLSRLAFLAVSHIFLWPLALPLGAWLLTKYGGIAGQLLVAVAVVAYGATYAMQPQLTGAWYNPGFVAWWRRLHTYFPVTTLLWDGTHWSSTPCPEHDAVYDVSRTTFVFAVHPHGSIPVGAAVLPPQLAQWRRISEKLRIAAASAVFVLPLVREFYLMFGSVSADRATVMNMLRRGLSVMVLPGGIREQLWVCAPGEEVIVLAKRTGFVRCALQAGASLVPVFIFGERRAYHMNRRLTLLVSRALKRIMNIGLPLVRGRWWTLLPFREPITIVFGAPCRLPQIADPDHATVLKWHAEYVKAVVSLYEQHKESCGYGDVRLVVR
jgi:1-acyl-sn-glycerol-3-phosphate acyltransferase